MAHFGASPIRPPLPSCRARVGITTLSPIRRRFYDAVGRTFWKKSFSGQGGCGGRLFYLREFWATVFFAAFLAWSIRGDRRYFKTLDERLALKLAAKAAAKAQTASGSGGGE